jgi:hypothetical protein
MRERKGHGMGREQALVARKRPRSMPAPQSDLWPVWCRGKLWTWESARFYIGRCQLCVYASLPTSISRRNMQSPHESADIGRQGPEGGTEGPKMCLGQVSALTWRGQVG